MTNRVTCINKNDRLNPYERITHLGGINPSGGYWKHTQQEIITLIESGNYSFYVEVNGNRTYLEVAISPYKNKYVKTKPDNSEPNNLLSLPECR